MASQTAARFGPAATSTWLIKNGPGTLYGLSVSPAVVGGTVVVADLVNAGANPNMSYPSTFGPGLILASGPFPASNPPFSLDTHGYHFSTGLTVSVTSTVGVFLQYD